MDRMLLGVVSCFLAFLASSICAARACSVFYEPEAYAATLSRLREPRLLNHVRDAAAIYRARVAGHRRSGEPEPPSSHDRSLYFTTEYRFSVVEALKGADVDSFWYRSKRPNKDYLAVPLYSASGNVVVDAKKSPFLVDADAAAKLRHSYFSFWVDDESLGVGESISPGDCRTYVFFETGVDYLFVLDSEGKTLSAERIASDDDAWLAAVRHVAAMPNAEDLGDLTFEALFSTLWGSIERMSVARCGRSPKIIQTDLITGEREDHVPRKAFWFDVGEDPYIEFPFNQSDCRKGSSYLAFDFHQWFPIDADDVVDLQGVAFEKRVVGETKIPMNQLTGWARRAARP
ncbi:MAG: hypothetical protein ABL957_16045 [Parvularculaceae bacterium]